MIITEIKNKEKEFFKKVKLQNNEELIATNSIYLLPKMKKHYSGYSIFEIIVETTNGNLIKIDNCADELIFSKWQFHLDVLYPSKIIHLFSSDFIFIDTKCGFGVFVYSEKIARCFYGNDFINTLLNEKKGGDKND